MYWASVLGTGGECSDGEMKSQLNPPNLTFPSSGDKALPLLPRVPAGLLSWLPSSFLCTPTFLALSFGAALGVGGWILWRGLVTV